MKKKTLAQKADTFSQQLIAECWRQMWNQSDFAISMDLIHVAVKFRKLILDSDEVDDEYHLHQLDEAIHIAERIELMMILLESSSRVSNNALFMQLSCIILQLEACIHMHDEQNKTA